MQHTVVLCRLVVFVANQVVAIHVHCPLSMGTWSNGLLPPELFVESARPMRLLAAKNQRLPGGTREIVVSLCLEGVDSKTGQPMELEIATRLYELGIDEDVLLSYAWLVSRNLDVLNERHGHLCLLQSQEKISRDTWVIKSFCCQDFK